MAEQPQGFARRMMAQKLMTDARNTPGSDSPFFAGRIRPSMADIEQPTRFSDMAMPAYGAAATGSLFVPGAGFADIFGGAPNPMQPGQMLPSFGENIGQGNYLDAGLQTLGAAGDVALAAGALFPPALPAAAALGTALKAPRAAKVADAAMDAADAAKIDPNQAAGAAMDLAQARYFDTGKFEPPTAENPVSVVLPTETEPGIIAFHGSGADFDEFRLEMIGTGEGAQAYGYGLYFTDSKDIAKYYKNTIANRDAMYGNLPIRYKGQKFAEFEDSAASEADPDKYRMINALGKEIQRLSYSPVLRTPENAKKQLLARLDNEIAQQRNAFKNESADVKDAMEEAFIASLQRDKDALERIDIDDITIEQTGKMYKVALSPKPDELLDYDLPLNQQPRVVQKQIENLVGDLLAGEPEAYNNFDFQALAAIKGDTKSNWMGQKIPPEGYSPTGDDILTDLQRFLETGPNQSRRAAMDASQLLNDFGIPGIKYRAAGSRGAATADEAAERNYVIFDDKAVKILEKYGIAGPVLVTGAAVAASKANNDNEDGGSILPDAGII